MTGFLMNKVTAVCGALSTVAVLAAPAVAQSQDDLVKAFSGDWYVFDPAFRSGGTECKIVLDPEMAATVSGCGAALIGIATWRIEDGQIMLADGADQLIAAMGGNQQRITGTLSDSGQGLIVERADGDGAAVAISNALGRHRCYFIGFTRTCAGPDVMAAPQPSAEDPSLGRIEVLANLNVRTQPRRDAAVIGVVKEGTPVAVDYCTVASDGVWCRAVFGTQAGWLAKTALRQNEWPIITYRISAE